MTIKTDRTNEPTVGINFFENIPPGGSENYSFRWKNSTKVKHVSNNTADKQTRHGSIGLNETQDNAVVKGFGSTPLFTVGLLVTSKQRIRLDDDGAAKNGKLSNAEDICKRNRTIVKNYWNEDVAEEGDNTSNTIKDEDEYIPTDFKEPRFASEYALKTARTKLLEDCLK